VHREIGGTKSAWTVLPRCAPGRRADHLQDRDARLIERRGLVGISARSKRRGRDNDNGVKP